MLYKDVGGTIFETVSDFYILLIAEALLMETKEQENIYVHCTNLMLRVGDCAVCTLALKY